MTRFHENRVDYIKILWIQLQFVNFQRNLVDSTKPKGFYTNPTESIKNISRLHNNPADSIKILQIQFKNL